MAKKKAGVKPGEKKLGTKDRIIQAASRLMEDKGYSATVMAEILVQSSSPKGSVYYHFPGGKEEIGAAAVLAGAASLAQTIRDELGGGTELPTRFLAFVDSLATALEAGDLGTGGPLTIVAAETASASRLLNDACQKGFDQVRDAFLDVLTESGFSGEEALALGLSLCAGLTGAITLARTYHRADYLRQVGKTFLSILAGPSGRLAV